MVIRSPPQRRVQLTPSADENAIPESPSIDASKHHAANGRLLAPKDAPQNAPVNDLFPRNSSPHRPLRPSPPGRPEDAQNNYWAQQMAKVLAQRDDAIARLGALEKAKNKQVEDILLKSSAEKAEWQELCDVLQQQLQADAASRTAQWTIERSKLDFEFEQLRKDSRLAIVQRDARIIQFQEAEFWLRLENKDLKRDVHRITTDSRSHIEMLFDREELLQLKVEESEAELEAARGELSQLNEFKKQNKAELKRLRQKCQAQEEEVAELRELRTSLKEELNGTKESLLTVTAQLDASRKSDKRESAELEGLREKKVDAEMKVKKLEEEAKTSRKEADRREKDLQRQLKLSEDQVVRLQRLILSSSSQVAESRPGVGSISKPKVASPRIQLEAEPESSFVEEDRDSHPTRGRTPSISSGHSDLDLGSPPLPANLAKSVKNLSSSSVVTAKASRRKAPIPIPKKIFPTASKSATILTIDDDSENGSRTTASKHHAKSTAAPTSSTASFSHSNLQPRISKAQPRVNGKESRADTTDDDFQSIPKSRKEALSPKARGKRRAPDEGPGLSGLSPKKFNALASTNKTSSTAKGRGSQVHTDEPSESEGVVEEPKKKKKRMIGGGFGVSSSSGVPVTWEPDREGGGFGVPSVLSPVITQRTAPPRSFSGQHGRGTR